MLNRTLSCKEVLVIVIILGVIVVLLLPNIMYSPCGSSQTTEISHLKGLVGIYIAGQTDKKTTPKSMGHRFWLAMFVGDPVGVEGGLKIDDVYASPSQAGTLLSPKDAEALSKDEISQAFENALSNEIQGWDQLIGDDTLYTSYAGPRNRRVFLSKPAAIVGCSGSRDGLGFFVDGFAVVYADQRAEFLTYEDLAEKYPDDWTGEEDEPNWNSQLLKSVLNLDNAKTPAKTQTQPK